MSHFHQVLLCLYVNNSENALLTLDKMHSLNDLKKSQKKNYFSRTLSVTQRSLPPSGAVIISVTSACHKFMNMDSEPNH